MKTKTLLNRVDTRLAACAAVAAAGTAISATPAKAAAVYSGPVNIAIPLTTSGVYLNVVSGAFSTSPSAAPGWDVNPYNSSNLSWFSATPSSSSGYIAQFGSSTTLIDNLAAGTFISAANIFSTAIGASESTGATAFNFNSNNNYVGFRFLSDSSVVSYGYLQIHLGSSFTDPARAIIAYAYDNAGGGITIVPEPTTFALLGVMGVGAMGVRAWRKRKAA